MSQTSALEEELYAQMRLIKLPIPEREWRFDVVGKRMFRFDFSWPGDHVACEVEGATWANGRHTRGSGFQTDCTKYNLAAIQGWAVIRVTRAMIEDGSALNDIEAALKASLARRQSKGV